MYQVQNLIVSPSPGLRVSFSRSEMGPVHYMRGNELTGSAVFILSHVFPLEQQDSRLLTTAYYNVCFAAAKYIFWENEHETHLILHHQMGVKRLLKENASLYRLNVESVQLTEDFFCLFLKFL